MPLSDDALQQLSSLLSHPAHRQQGRELFLALWGADVCRALEVIEVI
jgi:hypothetical protein